MGNLATLANLYGVTLEEIFEVHKEKLEKRYRKSNNDKGENDTPNA